MSTSANDATFTSPSRFPLPGGGGVQGTSRQPPMKDVSQLQSPVAPKFGGIVGGYAVWIGGPPLADFSGTSYSHMATPFCIRGLDPGNEIKSYKSRVEFGNHIKFKKSDEEYPLVAFADDCLRHMQQHGLDTVFYMEGAATDGFGGKELFTYHSRYSKDAVDTHTTDPSRFDDRHARTALKESAEWLLNSLDESMKKALRPVIAKKPNGPQLWMAIAREVQANSIRRCKVIAKEFENLSLLKFKGENVLEYCTKANELLVQLEKDNRLPETHLVDILDHLSECSVLEFKVPWLGKRHRIEEFLDEANGMEPASVLTLTNYIHFSDLLDEAKQMYINLNHKWGPSQTTISEAQTLKAQLKAMQSKLDSLNQELKSSRSNSSSKTEAGAGAGRNKKCWSCGKEDHLSKDCPQKGKGRMDNKEDKQRQSSKDPNMWNAPKAGEPQEKTINGKVWKWCAKCMFKDKLGRWTKTHSTNEHKDKSTAEAGGANLASASAQQTLFSMAEWSA